MRNHDIVVLLLLRVSFFILYVFILVYETAKWYKSSHDKKTVSSIILGKSIVCNGEDWCKTWFIRRDIKMPPVISRLI